MSPVFQQALPLLFPKRKNKHQRIQYKMDDHLIQQIIGHPQKKYRADHRAKHTRKKQNTKPRFPVQDLICEHQYQKIHQTIRHHKRIYVELILHVSPPALSFLLLYYRKNSLFILSKALPVFWYLICKNGHFFA